MVDRAIGRQIGHLLCGDEQEEYVAAPSLMSLNADDASMNSFPDCFIDPYAVDGYGTTKNSCPSHTISHPEIKGIASRFEVGTRCKFYAVR
jgi:hypothetical protein